MTKNLYLLFISTVLLLGFQSSIEERLYTLNRDLMCPVCDGLTLEQSQVAPALEMKEEIKKMIIQGMSDEEIKNHFVAKFGVQEQNLLENFGRIIHIFYLQDGKS